MEFFLDFLRDNIIFVLLGTVTLIQIAPIKIDPWSFIFKAYRNWMLGDIEEKIDALAQDLLGEKVNTTRWNILDFANSCRQGRQHTREEWEHCITELAWYENYCEKNNIPNGVIEESSKYLRDTYQHRLIKNDFL